MNSVTGLQPRISMPVNVSRKENLNASFGSDNANAVEQSRTGRSREIANTSISGRKISQTRDVSPNRVRLNALKEKMAAQHTEQQLE